MKKFLLGLLALIVLGAGGFLAKIAILDRPADLQAYVREALAGTFDVNSAAFAANVTGTLSGADTGNLELALTGTVEDATAFIPDFDYTLTLDSTAQLAGQDVKIAGILNLRALDEVFYVKTEGLTLTGLPAKQLAALQPLLEKFSGGWYSFDFRQLVGDDAQITELLAEQAREQEELRLSLRGFFASQDLLTVESFPLSFGEEQSVVAVLNTETLASDAFFAEIGKVLQQSEAKIFSLDAEKRAQLQEIIRKVLGQANPQITLRIGKKDGLLHSYDLALALNLAELQLAELPMEGQLTLNIHSENSAINQPQIIEAPADFLEFDPLELLPAPTAEEDGEVVSAEVVSE